MKRPILALLLILASQAITRANVTIEVPLFEGGAGKDWFLHAAREYEKARPGVTVDLYLDPRIADKVQVRILDGTYFEITNAAISYWPLIHNDKVLALDRWLDGPNWEGDATWRESFLPGSLDAYTENGKTYGAPLGYYAQVIWYNKKMFREHGWQPPRTWDELFALSAKIKAAKIAPMAFQGRYPYYAQPFYDAAYYHLGGPSAWAARNVKRCGRHDTRSGVGRAPVGTASPASRLG